MSNLTTRILSSIGFVVLILGPLFLDDKRIAFTLYAILGGFTLREIHSLITKSGGAVQRYLSFLLYAEFVYGAYSVFFLDGINQTLILAIGLTAFLGSVLEIFHQGSRPFQRVASSIWSSAVIGAAFLGIGYFMVYRDDLQNLLMTISVFGLVWINDSGAYLIGRKIGKTKLYERLSPNKTWEGSLAGFMAAMIAGYFLSTFDGMPSIGVMLGFSAVCVIFGSLGDLFESRLKRAANVKDSGKFLPGHGGFFDRFDAMILATPACILYFEFVLPKP